MAPRRRKLLPSLSSLVRSDLPTDTLTEAFPVIDDALAAQIVELAIRIGETMLVAGAPASEVTLTIVRVAGTYGLDQVHVEVSYNSITATYHRPGAERPITSMRVVRGAAPDHERLQRVQALVSDIRSGLDPQTASERFRRIRHTPFLYRPPAVVIAQGMLAVGVAIMFGAPWIVIVLAFVAAILAALTQYALAKAHVPYFFSQIAGAFVLTLAAAFSPLLALTPLPGAQDIRPSVIVASGIVLMLAGLTVVGAAQDAIDGFALTAMGRMLELTTHTLGVVLGILAALEVASVVGRGMDPPNEAVPLGAVPLQFLGAGLIAVAVAVYNGAGRCIIVVSTVLSLIAWAGYLAASSIGLDTAAASGIGAFVGSFVGVLAAYRLHVPSVAITIAAILPMVPGAAVFRGLLSIVEAGDEGSLMLVGFETLVGAAIVGISLAVGASLGIYLGQPVRASLGSVSKARVRLRR